MKRLAKRAVRLCPQPLKPFS